MEGFSKKVSMQKSRIITIEINTYGLESIIFIFSGITMYLYNWLLFINFKIIVLI